jgi:hypothetical protein
MRSLVIFLAVILCVIGFASAQSPFTSNAGSGAADLSLPLLPAMDGNVSAAMVVPDQTRLPLFAPDSLPRMGPDLALQSYENHMSQQNEQLASYSASTLIRAELPDTAQSGEYELARHYVAPRTLQFKAIHFTGDNFIKTNVIGRLLQSEVDHLQKDDLSMTALGPANYKFSYKGTDDIDGREVHVFQVKPRKKRAGLFKGRIYLDSSNGRLVRSEGNVVKSPSFFVKNVEFVQDYVDVNGFTLPGHMHSEARARIVGRAVVDVYQRDYQPIANPVQARQQAPAM